MYIIPAKPYRTEETIKRSRFVVTLARAATETDAKEFIASIKNEFSDANHNCWAYVAGPPGDSSQVGMSDDGEPRGTAGKPMLTVLLHSDIGEIVAVVSRYFGGTKLGTGGLVRAYSGCVKSALTHMTVQVKRDVITLLAIFDYPKVTRIKQMLDSFNARIIEEKYEADVAFKLEISKNVEARFIRAITNLTGGDIRLTRFKP